MRAAAYIRVSSKSQTLDMQRAVLERAARARRDTIVEWFSDKQSAGTLARPGLEDLRQAAREGRVPRLYLYRLDRLARSRIRDTFEVIEELRRHHCELVSVADGVDLSGPAAEPVLAVMAWAAKMERLAINERIAAARFRLEKEGRSWGRPTRLLPLERSRIALRAGARCLRQVPGRRCAGGGRTRTAATHATSAARRERGRSRPRDIERPCELFARRALCLCSPSASRILGAAALECFWRLDATPAAPGQPVNGRVTHRTTAVSCAPCVKVQARANQP